MDTKLNLVRQEKNITIVELARMADISHGHLVTLLYGSRNIADVKYKTVAKLAEILNVEISEIL